MKARGSSRDAAIASPSVGVGVTTKVLPESAAEFATFDEPLLPQATQSCGPQVGGLRAGSSAILVGAASFVLLAAAGWTTEIRVRGSVQSNYGTAYDVLVRPRGNQLPLEREQGLVRRNNYLRGLVRGVALAGGHGDLTVTRSPGPRLARAGGR
jgi:hypothetical protein